MDWTGGRVALGSWRTGGSIAFVRIVSASASANKSTFAEAIDGGLVGRSCIVDWSL